MSSAKYERLLSDEEIEALMRPKLDELMKFVEPSAKGSGMPANACAGMGDSPKERAEKSTVKTELMADEREYLESILEKPNLTVTGRRDHLGLSTDKNNQLKKALLGKGLVEELSLNLGYEARGIVKFLELTKSGFKAQGKAPRHQRPENCSAEHWWWQRNIAGFYESQGYDAQVEMNRNGKRADVGFVKDGMVIAVEVGLSPKNEVVNVQKDLEVGFDRVLVACRNTKVRKAVEQRLNATLSEAQLANVKLILLSEFSFVKEILGS